MTRPSWTDEQLSAFLDGELAAPEADALARDLEADATLAARLGRLEVANTAYVDAISRIDAAPMSPGLKAALAQPSGAKVIAFKPRSFFHVIAEHRAIAASLVCAVAVWGIATSTSSRTPLDPFAPGRDGLVMANSQLHEMLETASTGQASAVGDARAVPRLTFVSAEGAFCRQFDVITAASTSAAIACREEQGWRTQLVAYGLPSPTGDYQTASAARTPALEAYLDDHMAGAPLNAQAETALIHRGWKREGQ